MKRARSGKGDTRERRRYRNEGEEKKEQVDREYGLRKWREGQLEGGKIYLRATGVRIVRGRVGRLCLVHLYYSLVGQLRSRQRRGPAAIGCF